MRGESLLRLALLSVWIGAAAASPAVAAAVRSGNDDRPSESGEGSVWIVDSSYLTPAEREAADLAAQRDMAESARALVALTRWQFWASVVTLLFLGWSILLAWRTAKAATGGLKAAEDSNRINIQALNAASRPWVSVAMNVASDLVCTENELRLTIDFVAKNIGNTPALNLQLDAHLVPVWYSNEEAVQIHELKRQKYSDTREKVDRRLVGTTIFPGETMTFSYDMVVERDRIKAATLPGDIIVPSVYGAAEYVSPIDRELRQTGFQAMLMVDRHSGITTNPGTIQKERLHLQLGLFSGIVD